MDYWTRGRHPKTGEDLISAKALDGTTYWILTRTPKLSDKVPYHLSLQSPTESQQRKETPDKDNNTLRSLDTDILHL